MILRNLNFLKSRKEYIKWLYPYQKLPKTQQNKIYKYRVTKDEIMNLQWKLKDEILIKKKIKDFVELSDCKIPDKNSPTKYKSFTRKEIWEILGFKM